MDILIVLVLLSFAFAVGWLVRAWRDQHGFEQKKRVLQSELLDAQRSRDQAIKELARTKARWHELEKSQSECEAPRFVAKEVGTIGRAQGVRQKQPDDLKKISGIGPKLETLLHELGVYSFQQIASFTHADIKRIDSQLDQFKGRIERDHWVSQAAELGCNYD